MVNIITCSRELVKCGMVPNQPGMTLPNPPTHLPVLLDGNVVGAVAFARVPALVHHLRVCKVDSASGVPETMEVRAV